MQSTNHSAARQGSIYPFDFERKLGFDQIRQRLHGYCLSSLGRSLVDNIYFSADGDEINQLLRRAREFKDILERSENFPLWNWYDPTSLYPTIAIMDSFIEAEVLYLLTQSLQAALDSVDFLNKEPEKYPYLHQLTLPLPLPRQTVQFIFSVLDDKGMIKDSASADLRKTRENLRRQEHRVRNLVDHLFKEAVSKGWVPDGMLPVIRGGRVVIPILAEYKRKVRGVIMDESATGQTVYMEPTEVIEANNEIRDLELAVRREEIKILRAITAMLRERIQEVKLIFNFLAQLDFNQAKARLALEIDADIPQLVQWPALDWVEARHPLLVIGHKDKKPVVPLNITLTGVSRFLLVSGPNAGGKSVCLKTVGLIQYMMQCGLLVPVHNRSLTGVFNAIFLDIGDQQSIENDLSTYSSHLKNMAYFIARAGAGTLVLMDELGAGTDPAFGGGIAEAILGGLVRNKVWGVATTHYYNLKLFADRQEGVLNGAMLFDSRKLEPLFILEMGKPGSSFALEIAKKTGLPPAVIKEAEENIGQELTGLEALMKKVSDERESLLGRERGVAAKEKEYNSLLAKYHQLVIDIESKKKEIINKAKEEAALLLKQSNKEIEKTIRHIRENNAEKKETKKVRLNLRGLESKVRPEQEVGKQEPVAVTINSGDVVRMVGHESTGKVVAIQGDVATVQFGDMRSQIKLVRLIKSTPGEGQPRKGFVRTGGIDTVARQADFKSTLDVRGKRAEEVVLLLDQFLDNAIILSHTELRILHGKGEGVLRKVVRERLKQSKWVADFGDEHVERGGDGVTILRLK